MYLYLYLNIILKVSFTVLSLIYHDFIKPCLKFWICINYKMFKCLVYVCIWILIYFVILMYYVLHIVILQLSFTNSITCYGRYSAG